MNKTDVLQRIRDTGLIPVVRAESADLAMRAVEAIKAGGVDVLEVTMTVPGAIDVIAKLAATLGTEVVIGAGTVLDPDNADRSRPRLERWRRRGQSLSRRRRWWSKLSQSS